jgi:uroporphyrinogen-III decarboxylase
MYRFVNVFVAFNFITITGGIDKHVLRRSKEEIRSELEYKMQTLMQQGGVIFSLDHRIPNCNQLENYKYYIEIGREILGMPKLPLVKNGG